MPGIEPFQKALMYSPSAGLSGPLDISERLAPPYDITDPTLARQFVQRSPYSAAALESPLSVAPELEADEAHHRARRSLEEWMNAGVLRNQPRPGFVITRTTFCANDSVHRRTGLTALVPVANSNADGSVTEGLVDHEERSAHLEDNRYAHLNAMRCQTSPVLALYDDEYGDVETCLRSHMIACEPSFVGATSDGVVHEAWMMDDPTEMEVVKRAFGSRAIVIADGHNRYKAHVRYVEELDRFSATHPARWCAANLVAQQDDGLLVRSMYHLFAGMDRYNFDDLLARTGQTFNVNLLNVPLAGLLPAVEEAWLAGSHPIGVHDTASGRSAVLTTHHVDPLAANFRDFPEAWRRSDAVVLEHLFVRPILEEAINTGAPIARDAVTSHDRVGDASPILESPQLVAVVLPIDAGTIIDLASARCLLPPSTAQFWPTFPAGFVFHSLE